MQAHEIGSAVCVCVCVCVHTCVCEYVVKRPLLHIQFDTRSVAKSKLGKGFPIY